MKNQSFLGFPELSFKELCGIGAMEHGGVFLEASYALVSWDRI